MVLPLHRPHADSAEASRGTEDVSQMPQQRSNIDVTDSYVERPRTSHQTTTLHYSAEKALGTNDIVPGISNSYFV